MYHFVISLYIWKGSVLGSMLLGTDCTVLDFPFEDYFKMVFSEEFVPSFHHISVICFLLNTYQLLIIFVSVII